MLISCRKFCCWWQFSFYSRSTLPKNFLLLFLKTVYVSIFFYFCINIDICFAYSRLGKSVPCLVYIFERYNRIFGATVSDTKSHILRAPIQLLTPPDRACEKLSDTQSTHLNLLWKRSWSKLHGSSCLLWSQFLSISAYFFQSFWVKYFTSNYTSSRGLLPKTFTIVHYDDLPY